MKSRPIPISKSRKIKVGITIGDPSGIGPEITLKVLSLLEGRAEFTVIGDKWVLERVNRKSRKPLSLSNYIDLGNVKHRDFSFGKTSAEYGRASIEYLDCALGLLKQGRIDCLVTCPISKESINKAGFPYTGHTEYLTANTKAGNTLMMLLNKELKFGLLTRHLAIKDIPAALTSSRLRSVILLAQDALRKLFLIRRPRVIVCGLNPHASDNGLLGKEENTLIRPVLRKLGGSIKGIYGPLPADIAIARARQKQYDCVIAIYHDQALIPLKLLDPRRGVNLTVGLPFIRTSPLHGTAFDIAGRNLADPLSLSEAVGLAIKCTLNQKKA